MYVRLLRYFSCREAGQTQCSNLFERQKKIPIYLKWEKCCGHSSAFLIGTSSFLQETRTCIKRCTSSNSNMVRPLTAELPALERLENQCTWVVPVNRGHF